MKYNILVTPDNKFIQHADVMLTSLFMNNKQAKFDVYILTSTITETDFLVDTIRNFGNEAYVIRIKDKQVNDFSISLHASSANYYRILIGTYLCAEIDRILYLDTDIIINGNILPLFEFNLGKNIIAAVAENPIPADKKRSLGLPETAEYFNSGVLLIDLKRWKMNDLTKVLSIFIINNPSVLEYWDQDALNAVLKDKWTALPKQYNFLTSFCNKKVVEKPVIIHYSGKSKPWQYMDKHPFKSLYYKYISKTRWKNFKPGDASIGNFLRKYNLFPNWLYKSIIQEK